MRNHGSPRAGLLVAALPLIVALLTMLGACVPAAPPPLPNAQVTASLTPSQPAPTPGITHTVNLPLIQASLHPTATPTPTASPTPPPPPPLRFAVIGDYGSGDSNAAEVAALVQIWEPALILTTGDNNYPSGEASTIDQNVGQFYHSYIYPYLGSYGDGADENRFFPTLGNHDWDTPGAQPYLDYFTLAGNERYYDFILGPVHFFALDSDSREPDGVGQSSIQASWLQAGLAASTAPWKVIIAHHPPYSSGLHGSITWMRWPFQEWGASLMMSGHDHTYERIELDGFTYLVNGLGGGARYDFVSLVPGSLVRYNADYGALLVEVTSDQLAAQFINVDGEVIDSFTLDR